MAGDPITDCTQISFDFENTWDTTYSNWEDPNSTATYSVPYTITYRPEEDIEKIKKLIKKKIIQDMKDQWNEFQKEFVSVPKIRPSGQLRGVCFGGRGWA